MPYFMKHSYLSKFVNCIKENCAILDKRNTIYAVFKGMNVCMGLLAPALLLQSAKQCKVICHIFLCSDD